MTAAVVTLAVLASVGLVGGRPASLRPIGALALVADLALTCGQRHTIGSAAIAASCGLVVLAVSHPGWPRLATLAWRRSGRGGAAATIAFCVGWSLAPTGPVAAVAGVLAVAALLTLASTARAPQRPQETEHQ